MTMLTPEQQQPHEAPAVAPKRSRGRIWLIVVLVVALLAAVGVGVWAVAGSSSGESDASKLVKDYTKALNDHDVAAMKALSAPEATFTIVAPDSGLVIQGPYRGDAYYAFMQDQVFPSNPSWELLSGVVEAEGSQATVITRMTGDAPLGDLTGTMVLSLATVDDQLRVTAVTWLPGTS